MNLLSKNASRLADDYAMNNFGIKSAILMENAAISSFNIIRSYVNTDDRIIIICGSGNNGGDGYAIARHLHSHGYDVTVLSLGAKSRMSPETFDNYNAVKSLGINIIENHNHECNVSDLNSYRVYVEALIGVGGDEKIKSNTAKLLKKINACEGLKIAVDVPAGLNADTGIAHKDAFKADLTISMFAPKIGLYLNDGKKISGKIYTAYLGVPTNICDNFSDVKILEKSDIRANLPLRDDNSSKHDFGKVLVIAGSEKYSGAGALASNAALRSGAGLVYIASTCFHKSLMPEIIKIKLKPDNDMFIAEDNYDTLLPYIDKSDALVIGPGAGTNDGTLNLFRKIIDNFPEKKVLLDADGLLSISAEKVYNKNLIITPHIYEFSRLICQNVNEFRTNELNTAIEYSKKMNCIIHLKYKPSISTDGKKSFLTINGNAGMSSGGSGDVLSGIAGAYLSQGLKPLSAISTAAFVHALSGDICIKKQNKESLAASDLIENLKYCFE
ncbi:NAD(P)H-hydrate dehydratase [Candidatus Kapaibacterium sp.]